MPEPRPDMFGFIEAIHDLQLANGLRLLVLPRPEIPSVALACYLPTGSTMDPAGKEGLANLVARGIGDGTPTRSKEELDETIDFVGGSYQFSAGMEGSSGGMQFLAEHLPLALELMADTLQNPLFPPEEVDRGRKQLVGSIKSQLERPGDLCERRYVEQLLAGTPYGHNVDGDILTLEGMTRDDLVGFHQALYGPQQLVVTVVGDCDPAAVARMVEERFGAWAPHSTEALPPAVPAAPDRVVAEVIDRPVHQANIRLGFPAIPRLHPDYAPFVMMNYILGGASLASRITVTVRDNQGLAYQVASRYTPMRHLGLFTVVLQTSNTTANQALEGVCTEMRRMKEDLVTEEELADARSFYRDRFPLTIETNGSMAGQLLNIGRYGLPVTHFCDSLEELAAVTREDIQRVAQQYLTEDRFVLTVVGNAAEARIPYGEPQAVGSGV
ncbi:MAG TPA: pitrilysin family protein [bacterium]|nr:pitrilysin family protein [bacterium]